MEKRRQRGLHRMCAVEISSQKDGEGRDLNRLVHCGALRAQHRAWCVVGILRVFLE